MPIGEAVNIEQLHFQNNRYPSFSYRESTTSTWKGHGVNVVAAITVAAVAVVALAVLAKGGTNSWWETECGFNFWGDYVCWDKICHYEQVCVHDWDITTCYIEKVCTHFN